MDGIFLLDKPRGPSSRHAIDRFAKQLPRKLRFGHAGTLDPLASGLLILATGKATRMIQIYQDMKKTYLATIRLGFRSDTDDSEGPLTPVMGVDLPQTDQILSELQRLTGEMEQTPPAFSAAKVKGKRAYALARAGRPELPTPKMVQVHSVELLEHSRDKVTVRWEVGSGTYIRSLARDLGEALGCGAYLDELRRTHIGPFDADKARSLEQQNREGFISMEETLNHLPRFRMSKERCRIIVAGKRLPLNDLEKEQWAANSDSPPGGLVTLIDPNDKMLGILDLKVSEEGEPLALPWKFFFHVSEIDS